MGNTTLMNMGFNPCFNGTYSLTHQNKKPHIRLLSCFNPCFNGTYSLTLEREYKKLNKRLKF